MSKKRNMDNSIVEGRNNSKNPSLLIEDQGLVYTNKHDETDYGITVG